MTATIDMVNSPSPDCRRARNFLKGAVGERPYRVKDLSEQRFDRLCAIRVSGKDHQNRAVWLCRCDCGRECDVPSRHLVQGKIRSCGCMMREQSARNGVTGRKKNSGAASHLYRPDLADDQRHQTRNEVEVREWRKAVFLRDDYTCQVCGAIGVKINAHHLESWAKAPSLRYEVNNGVTLCASHHDDFHTWMGGRRIACGREDFLRWRQSLNGNLLGPHEALGHLNAYLLRLDETGEAAS